MKVTVVKFNVRAPRHLTFTPFLNIQTLEGLSDAGGKVTGENVVEGKTSGDKVSGIPRYLSSLVCEYHL